MTHTGKALELKAILDWCTSLVGPCETTASDPRIQKRASVLRLRSSGGFCYLKLYRQASAWETEVHGYERWAPAFGSYAPQLLGVHESEPLALLIGELAGKILDDASLPIGKEMEVWRAAGQGLRRLHEHAEGTYFGALRRDGQSAGNPITSGQAYIQAEFERWLQPGRQLKLMSERELAVVQAAQAQAGLFAKAIPAACHRDYGPANWVINENGEWAGVIDFEFAHWDVRVSDFSRYPNWEWIQRPELLEAFFQGYGRPLSAQEQAQCLVTRTLYAVSAVVWGHQNAYYGFEAEGRQALDYIGKLIRLD